MCWAAVSKQVWIKKQQLPNTKILLNCICIFKATLIAYDKKGFIRPVAKSHHGSYFEKFSLRLDTFIENIWTTPALAHLPKLSSIETSQNFFTTFPISKGTEKLTSNNTTPWVSHIKWPALPLFCNQGIFLSFEN